MSRTILTLALALTTALAFGQAPRTFLVRSASPLDVWRQKMVFHVVLNEEPFAMVSFDTEQFKIRTSAQISGQALVQALNNADIGSFELIIDPEQRMNRGTDAALPAQTNTGDPLQDAINYGAAKSAWISTHPDAYRAMIDGTTDPVMAEPIPTPE